MAYTGTITTEAEIAIFAGENVDATGDTEANRNLLVAQAEAYLSAFLQDDVVAGYENYDSVTKKMLNEWAARYTANALVAYNMQGYGTEETAARIHGEDIINLNLYMMEKIEKILKEGWAQKQLGVNAS